MPLDTLMSYVQSLGVPIVFSVVLLWVFVGLLKSSQAKSDARLDRISEQNSTLIAEVAKLQQNSVGLAHAMQLNEKLMQQNERLVESIRSKEDAFIKLLQAINGASEETHG